MYKFKPNLSIGNTGLSNLFPYKRINYHRQSTNGHVKMFFYHISELSKFSKKVIYNTLQSVDCDYTLPNRKYCSVLEDLIIEKKRSNKIHTVCGVEFHNKNKP